MKLGLRWLRLMGPAGYGRASGSEHLLIRNSCGCQPSETLSRHWVPDTAVHPVKDFVEEACSIVGARLESGDHFALVPSEIMERLEDSGILARYNVRVTKPLPATLRVGEWVPADEVVEVPYPTMAGWLDVIRGVEESREKMRQTIETEND